MKRALVVYGTRPEQIKLRSVIEALQERGWEVHTHFTGQSKDLIEPDGSNAALEWRGGLPQGVGSVIENVGFLGNAERRPDVIIVQGDTASAFAGAVAGYLAGIDVAHVEAGLRTYEDEPYPEEGFRGAIARFATLHFAPDGDSALNLASELNLDGLKPPIYVTGNPGIDALKAEFRFEVLVTLHRRENWGSRGLAMLRTIRRWAEQRRGYANVTVIRHPNWADWGADAAFEAPIPSNLNLRDPVAHKHMALWVKNSALVVTDSGGLQEEAAFFGTPCLVLRNCTERRALEKRGIVELVKPERLLDALNEQLERRFLYGSGDSGVQIADILEMHYGAAEAG